MGRKAGYAKCEALLRDMMGGERTCGRPARYVIYETRRVCKACYQRHQAGWLARFSPGRMPTPEENWRFWERLRSDVVV